MATKSCPITTVMTANHPPVVAPVSNYTIPILTPFALTGSATDPESDPITYCWEQNDVHGGQTGANSVAYAAKPARSELVIISCYSISNQAFSQVINHPGRFTYNPSPSRRRCNL